jgi:hypothetical protein
MALAPEWTSEMQEQAIQAAVQASKARIASKQQEIDTGTAEIFRGTDFEKPTKTDPFVTPPQTASDSVTRSNPWDSLNRPSTHQSQHSGNTSATYGKIAADTFQDAGYVAPCKLSIPLTNSNL